jgi:sulfur carrier protein ThiS
MKIRVFMEREGRERVVRVKGRAGDLLRKLGINPESVIIARGRDLVTEDSPLRPGDKIRIIHIKVSD